MRRWNGWGDDSIAYPAPPGVLEWLSGLIGAGQPPQDVTFEEAVRAVPESRLRPHPLISTDPAERLRHARGQSVPDWVALRSGHIDRYPAGVATPQSEDDLLDLFDYARRRRASLIPYGGGTSVVGHINPAEDGPPSLSVDLSYLNALESLDETSHLATFGAGIRGPHLEAALRAKGYTLGHFPQSFELSTLGGWVATRSSGQQSLHYGRIEDLFAGGRLLTPEGPLDMLPYPASAAGPDLRQVVLGSEGRLGVISRATVRISPLPEVEEFHGIFFPEWEAGVAAVRAMAQARLPLSMLRLSNPTETEANLVLAGHAGMVALAQRGLGALGYRRDEKCMLVMGVTGAASAVWQARDQALRIARRHDGLNTGQFMGKAWSKNRFLAPYLRNTLWEAGYMVDTLETALPWSEVLDAEEIIPSVIRGALAETGERVHVFAHLSHLYPTGASLYVTYIFRLMPDPDQTLEHWRLMKRAASLAILARGGTISHQHGVGVDHAPYLEAEKGTLGIDILRRVAKECDPHGLMNPGKLFI